MTAPIPERIRQLSRLPVWVSPMAGGPSVPGLVTAAAQAGGLGWLAAGYKTPAAMAAEISAVRAAGTAAFGVNVFVPGSPARDAAALATYVASLQDDARQVSGTVGEPGWDDDHWDAKLAALAADPPPAVSFTFGCPAAGVVRGLQEAGALVVVTVTDEREAAIAAGAGADALCVQGPEAGAHRGTFSNEPGADADHAPRHETGPGSEPSGGRGLLALLAGVAGVTDLPLIAAGGIASADAAATALAAGAVVVQAGTAFLRCPESGAHPLHKAALADPHFTATVVTRAFSGRPARALVNQFTTSHAGAPAAYPEINNATRPLRAAAGAAGDTSRMSLYAGEGFRSASSLSAGEIMAQLAEGVS
ncbi:MAG: nitronate monooxygenase [Actinomycetota bacterium]